MSKEEMIKQIETIVFEALGTASMCWSETPKGIFDSSQASNVGNEAVSNIMKLYAQLKQDEQSEGEENKNLRKIAEDLALEIINIKDTIRDVLKEYIENVNESDNITETLEGLINDKE
jgi:hypothetical protein